MRIGTFSVLFWLLGHVSVQAQTANSRHGVGPRRVASEKHKFSVLLPTGWFYYLGGDLPSFYNFTPGKSIQGHIPSGGASIVVIRNEALSGNNNVDQLSAWADERIKRRHGINSTRTLTEGPKDASERQALYVSFDQPAFSQSDEPLRFVIALWRFRDFLLGAELSYIKGDPKAIEYERLLHVLTMSFRPT